jgi:ribosomal peptide maturation radical SAM protein 1
MAGLGRLALVSMPWNNISRPSIQVGVLRSVARDAGWDVLSYYAYLEFYGLVRRSLRLDEAGCAELYEEISEGLYHLSVGDWIFTRRHGDAGARAAFFELLRARQVEERTIELIDELRGVADAHVKETVRALLDYRPDVIGFTSTFSQNGPTLATVEELRAAGFDGTVVLGGSNCEGPMGHALLRNFPAVDAVVDGPGEDALEDLLRQVEAGASVVGSRGRLVGRQETPATAISVPAERKLEVPGPDYDGFFEQLSEAGLDDLAPEITLPVEFSRGCWWGEKTHCTFCGLNGATMRYRSKDPASVAGELDRLMSRYGVLDFFAVDNILDRSYLDSALPQVERLGSDHSLFFEVKANLEWSELQRLRRAGVRSVQPGIESLSTDALRALKKGATTFQNLRFLLGCAEFGIRVGWNILTGFPAETEESIRSQIDLIRSLTHLDPPDSDILPVHFDRFSPYVESPEAYDLRLTKPLPGYRFAFPTLSEEDLWEIAYHFEGEFADEARNDELRRRLAEGVRAWRRSHGSARFEYRLGFDCVRLIDQRPGLEHRDVVLRGARARLFRAVLGGARLRDLERQDWDGQDWESILATVEEWRRLRWVFVEKNKVIALAVRSGPSAYRSASVTDAEKRSGKLLPIAAVS